MQRITGLPDDQVVAWEEKLEAQVVASLQAVMDKIAARIERVMVAAVTTGPTGDEDPPPMTGQLAIPDPVPSPATIPVTPNLPPGQPYISPDDLASITPLWQQQVADQVLPLVAQVFIDSVGHVRSQILDAVAPGVLLQVPGLGSVAAEQYLAQARNTYKQVGDHLWTTARAQLSQGFEAGESIPQLAARLRQSAGLSARTSVMVARTSVIEASNAGSMSMARASGYEMLKEWIATPDLRTRPTHLAADGQRVPLHQPFKVGGYSADYPAALTLPPSERYRCRCTTGYVMPDKPKAITPADPELGQLPGTSGVPEDLSGLGDREFIEATYRQLGGQYVPQGGDLGGLRAVIDEKGARVLPKTAAPGGAATAGEVLAAPTKVRSSLLRASTPQELTQVWQAEMRTVTGRDIIVNLPPDASVLTMREHAEGVIQMLERFPEARLRKISWFDDPASANYAHVRRGSATVEFNARFASEAGRRQYLASLRSDVKGWTDPAGNGVGWSVRGARIPQATSWHEMGHVLSIETLGGGKLDSRALSVLHRAAAREGVDADTFAAREISAYAGSNGEELIAEAMADVMANGARASAVSREIYDLVATEYRARGLAVRTSVSDLTDEFGAEDLGADIFPRVAGPRALSSQTVVQLRALAKERGITVPPGTRKADLVRLLDEAPLPPAGAGGSVGLSTEVQTSLSAVDQARVRTLVRSDPQIYATVQDRFGSVSTSGNLSQADAAWLQEVYGHDRPFIERVAQEAQIARDLDREAKKLGMAPAAYRAREAAKLKDVLDGKPIAVRVRDESGLQDILSGGRFKTSLEGAKRGAGLRAAKDSRRLGETVMGVPADIPIAERPVYGYVGIHGIEPALSPGRKIAGIAQMEGQEDILSVYGQVTVALKPGVRARTTVTVGDSLDELAFVRPSPIDAPSADSLGIRGLEAIERPDFTRHGYVEAQIQGGLRREDIAEVFFADEPAAATVAALRDADIPWRVLRRTDEPVFLTAQISPTRVPVAAAPSTVSAAVPARVAAARAELARVAESPVTAPPHSIGGSSAKNARVSHEGGDVIVKDYTRDSKAAGVRDADAEELGALVMDALDVPTQTVLRTGERQVTVSILEGDFPADIGMGLPGPARQALADTDGGRLLGLGDVLIGNSDRRRNFVRLADGTPASFDLGGAFRAPKLAAAADPEGTFAHHFATKGGKAWAPNDMAPADLALIRQRLEALKPEFDRLGRQKWHTQMVARLAEVEKRATGTRTRLAEAASDAVGPEARAVARQAASLGADGDRALAIMARPGPVPIRPLVTGPDEFVAPWAIAPNDPDYQWLRTLYERDPKLYNRVARQRQVAQTWELDARKKYPGKSLAEAQVEATRALREAVADAPIIIRRATEANLRRAIADGRLKTQFETGTSSGLLDVEARRRLEDFTFDLPEGLPLAERPVYGVVSPGGVGGVSAKQAVDGYGEIQLVLRPEIRLRTTVTVGDSLSPLRAATRPAPIDDVDWQAAGPHGVKNLGDARFEARDYVEAQVRGGVRMDDIQEIVFPKLPESATIEALDQSGISWRVLKPGSPRVPVVPPNVLADVAVARQVIIDERRAVADSLAEARELLANGASQRALAARARLIAGRTTGAAGDDLAGLVRAMESGDTDQIRTAVGDVAARRGLTAIDAPAGQDWVPFDPKLHEVLPGEIRPPAGTFVHVSRPGYSVRLDDGEVVQLAKAKVDTLTKDELARIQGEAVEQSAAAERKALREAARERNRVIESQRGTARLLAEVDELAAKGATKTVIRERLDPALREAGQAYAGADAAAVDVISAALDSGDLAKVRAAVTRASTKAKIKPIGRAGAKTTFDPDTMEGVGGIDIAPGAKVTVVRRGSTVPGLTDPLAKAQVTPVAPVKAASKVRPKLPVATGQDALDAVPFDTTGRVYGPTHETDAIDRYRLGPNINDALRGQTRRGREIRDIHEIDQVFDTSRLTHDAELWRSPGSGREIFGDPKTWGDDLSGFEWMDQAYSSTSASRLVADRFTRNNGVRLRILAPKGSKAIQLSEMPEKGIGISYVTEAEVLLARGTQFRVVRDHGWTEIKGSTHVVRDLDVEVVVPDETPPLPWATK